MFERKRKSAPSPPSLSLAPGGGARTTGLGRRGQAGPGVRGRGWALSQGFLRAREEGYSGMEFGLVRQTVKLKNSTATPTV